MTRFMLLIWMLAVLPLVLPGLSSAMPDFVQEKLLHQYPLPLRWDNVEKAPDWAGGLRPRYSAGVGLHQVILEPEDEVRVRIPAGEQLRIYNAVNPLAGADLEVSLSDGSGLFAVFPVQPSVDGHSLLLTPAASAPMLARVRSVQPGGRTLSLALFLSRRQPLEEIAPYRQCLAMPGNTFALRVRHQAVAENFYRIAPRQPLKIEVDGPWRLALENRLAYPPDESEVRLGYRVWARLDDGTQQVFEFAATVANSEPVFVDGKPATLGRLETGYLEIPAGRHTLELDSTAPLFLRLLGQNDPDYLIAGLNAPQPTAAEVRERPVPELLRRPWNAVSDSEIENLAVAEAVADDVRERLALAVARDNRRRDGGLLAASLMKQAAAARPDEPRLATLAGRIEGSHSFYRDLLPVNKPETEPQRFAWVLVQSLADPQQRPTEALVTEQHLEAGLDQLVGAQFVPVTRQRPGDESAMRRTEDNRQSLPLPGDVLFDTDRYELRPEAVEALAELGDWLLRYSRGEIRVIGHTDSRATDAYNQQLSERRAASVTLFLARRGIAPERLLAVGRGEREPRAGNDSDEGMQRNRRVEVDFQAADPTPPPVVERGQLYRLPEQEISGALRLLAFVEGTPGAEFKLQFDDRPPIPLRLDPLAAQPKEEFERSTGQSALELLNQRHPQTDAGPLGGPFAVRRVPAPRQDAASLELELPVGTREIRVWREGAGCGRLFLALQYRASRPYQLAESSFMEMQRRSSAAVLTERLALLLRGNGSLLPNQVAEAELDNHLWPLVRWLQSRERAFAASVIAETPSVAASLDANQLESLQARAEQAEADGDWLGALEDWSRMLQGLPAKTSGLRPVAQLGQIRSLQELGETFLAERRLRVMLLNEADPVLREQAFVRLEQAARDNGDLLALQNLLAVQAVREPSPRWFKALAESLVESGDYPLALAAGLAGYGPEPAEPLLRAAFQLSWWELFESLAGRLDAERQGYWLGLRRLEQGNIPEARHLFGRGGTSGRVLLQRLDAGLLIQRRLQNREAGERESALVDWERWQADAPGPFAWREEPGAVLDYAGVDQLYSIDTDRYGRAYRSAPGRPLRMQLVGPVRLRLEVRPLHPAGSRKPFDGWLQIKEKEALRLMPVSGNQPSPGLALIGSGELAAGTLEIQEFDFGPGVHELELACAEGSLLIRPQFQRPEIDLGVLPPLTTETVWAAARGLQPGQSFAVDEQELRALYARLGERRPVQDAAIFRALAAGDLEGALAAPVEAGEAAAEQRLTLLLWLAEQQPDQHLRALGEAEALGGRYPQRASLKPLLARLARGSRWEPLTSVVASAGLRLLPVSGWQPDSPVLRVRQALLTPMAEGEQVVYSGSSLVLGMLNLQASCLRLELQVEDASLQPPTPLTALVAVDAEPPRRISLTAADVGETLELCVPAGRHSVRVGIEQPLSNQYLRVRLLEQGPQGSTPLIQQFERPWQVATAAEPLRLLIPGPAWLRIDELRQGVVSTRYREVTAGWQEIVLAPEPGQSDRLLRVQQKQVTEGVLAGALRPSVDTSVPVPGPLLRLAPPPVAERLRLEDGFPLGGQEDGTWSGYLSLERRFNIQEDTSAGDDPEQFAEVGAIHRFYDAFRQTWYKSTALARLREHGGPTFGLEERIVHRPRTVPVTLRLDANAYLQDLSGLPVLFDERTDLSLSLKGSVSQIRAFCPKLWHRPELTLFARYLTRDHSPGSPDDQERLDRDVFSPYKAQHRYGWGIGDTLTYRPWLDTLLYAGLSFVSNEDLDLLRPDYRRDRLGAKQLLGPFDLELGYQASHYFDDGDRRGDETREQIFADISWDYWMLRQHRLELRLSLTRDLDRDETLGLFSFFWHGGNGRGYRDFWPGEVDFLDLRQRRASQVTNNGIYDEAGH